MRKLLLVAQRVGAASTKGKLRYSENQLGDVCGELHDVVCDRSAHDHEAGKDGCKQLWEHRLGKERGRVSGEALFFAALAREFGTPDFFLAFLICDEAVR